MSDEERMKQMKTINPCYVLRNWMAQEAINKAEDGDYSEVCVFLFCFEYFQAANSSFNILTVGNFVENLSHILKLRILFSHKSAEYCIQ